MGCGGSKAVAPEPTVAAEAEPVAEPKEEPKEEVKEEPMVAKPPELSEEEKVKGKMEADECLDNVMTACKKGKLLAVKFLLFQKPDLVFHRDGPGDTPLIEACSNCQLAVAKLLLDCGSQVNAANATQTTALHWAARRSLEDLLELLLSAGATPRAATLQGDTPLHDAAANATAAALRRLLAAGATAEANQQGQTPLHVAAFNGRLEACQVLLEAGHSPEDKDKDGDTVLDVAKKRNHEAVIKLLEG